MPTRKSNNPEGRPSEGKTEDQQLVRGPRALLEAMRQEAERARVTVAEAWREAAREWLERNR